MVTFGMKKDVSPYKCLVGIMDSGSREVPKVIAPDSGDRVSASGRKDKG